MIGTIHNRKAFTLLELTFVIMILGIVASIGAEIIAQTYENYIIQRAQYRAATKTELALNQIANRLRYAIPSTVVARPNPGGAFVNITEVPNPNYRVLQWVGYDGDSFESLSATGLPGWSGFCDLNASSDTALTTPGSNLSHASTIIANLEGNISNSAVFFPYENGQEHNISSVAGNTITLSPAVSTIYERYKLAWTSYALEVNGNNDLILHYNFAPAKGANIGGSSAILLHNVTNFRFKGSEGALRVKICKSERVGADINATVHTCKEKVIF